VDGFGVIPWRTLARGVLTRPWGGEPARSDTDKIQANLYAATAEADRKVVEAVEKIAAARGIPMAQVALAWVLAKSEVTAPIVGVSKMAQLDDALGALEVKLSDEEIAALGAPYVPHAVAGHD
jgi:aryl-alcohol dehydrogenase-like predicted oxidoreductase